MISKLYAYAGLAILFVAMAGWLKVTSARLEACQAEFQAFRLQVKTLGEEAERKAKEREAADLLNKEQIDEKTAKLTADLAVTAKRLRDANTARSFMSNPSPVAGSAQNQCYDRTLLDAALQRFTGGTASLIEEGGKNTLALKLAVEWGAGSQAKDSTIRSMAK